MLASHAGTLGSFPEQSTWDFWCKNCHFSQFFCINLSIIIPPTFLTSVRAFTIDSTLSRYWQQCWINHKYRCTTKLYALGSIAVIHSIWTTNITNFPPDKLKIMSDAMMETVLYVTPPRVLHSRIIDDHFIAKLLSIYNRLTSITLHFSRNIGEKISLKFR
jgi:hypothetical protein